MDPPVELGRRRLRWTSGLSVLLYLTARLGKRSLSCALTPRTISTIPSPSNLRWTTKWIEGVTACLTKAGHNREARQPKQARPNLSSARIATRSSESSQSASYSPRPEGRLAKALGPCWDGPLLEQADERRAGADHRGQHHAASPKGNPGTAARCRCSAVTRTGHYRGTDRIGLGKGGASFEPATSSWEAKWAGHQRKPLRLKAVDLIPQLSYAEAPGGLSAGAVAPRKRAARPPTSYAGTSDSGAGLASRVPCRDALELGEGLDQAASVVPPSELGRDGVSFNAKLLQPLLGFREAHNFPR